MSKQATDYKPDPNNANKGTERGVYMLEKSLEETGLGRSIVVDKNGVVIAGNKTLQAAIDAGLIEVKEVETDGKQLVVVRRTDLDLSEDERARKLAYFDNRAGQVGLDWDSEQLLADIEAGLDLESLFFDWELDNLLDAVREVQDFDPAAEWQGMPEYEHGDPSFQPVHHLILRFWTEEAMELFARFVNQTVTKKTRFINYPLDAAPADISKSEHYE
jgi:hypothetical protein